MNDTALIVQVGDLIQTKNDKSKQLQSSDYQSNGILPIVDQGSKPICGYTNDLSKRYDKGLPVVIFGDHTLHTKFIDFHFAIGADGTQVLAPKSEDCDTKYLYYLISRATELIGSEGYKRHFKILKEFDIEYIKPLSEQKKIAAILSSVDEVIEKTRAQIDKLKDLKTGMMQELLTKGIGHAEFKDSPVGRIPAGWDLATLEELSSFITSGSRGWAQYYSASGAIFIRIGNLTRDHINLRFVDTVYVNPPDSAEGKRTQVQTGDVLISITADLGVIGVVNESIGEAYVNQHISLVRMIEPEIARWVGHFLAFENTQKQFIANNDAGAKAGLNLTAIRKTLVALPPTDERVSIVDSLDSIDQAISMKRVKLLETQDLKKALMQDLLTGKVRVQVDTRELADA